MECLIYGEFLFVLDKKTLSGGCTSAYTSLTLVLEIYPLFSVAVKVYDSPMNPK